MSDENFNLEKKKIHERLQRVETHMEDATRLRIELVSGFKELKTTVDNIHKTVFGFEKESGMYHEMKEISSTIIGVRTWLSRIFWLVMSYLVVVSIPAVTSAFYNITHIK